MCSGMRSKLLLLTFLAAGLYQSPLQAQPAFGPQISFNQFQFGRVTPNQINFPRTNLQSNTQPQLQFNNLQFPSFATPISDQQTHGNRPASSLRPNRSAPTRSQQALAQTPPLQVSRAFRERTRTAEISSIRQRRQAINPLRAQVLRAARNDQQNRARLLASQPSDSRRN
ncbi:hypothetical protein Pla110_12510 [Polystyrenella longa]|uniref:Uncharacterized protein n=1 Tax=Polystyrenella longa TaxID=2528007 RepID=A0A518CJZ8_9PLAN|nr:hypothetical protein Pla110_12510 [Polystyrenella longa]